MSNTDKIEDFGEYIGGARKEFYTHIKKEGVSTAFLQSIFEDITMSFVSSDFKPLFQLKSTWQLPTIADLKKWREDGVPKEKLYFIYLLVKIALRPNFSLLKDLISSEAQVEIESLKTQSYTYVRIIEVIRDFVLNNLHNSEVSYNIYTLCQALTESDIDIPEIKNMLITKKSRPGLALQSGIFLSIFKKNTGFIHCLDEKNLKFFSEIYDFPNEIPPDAILMLSLNVSEQPHPLVSFYSSQKIECLSFNIIKQNEKVDYTTKSILSLNSVLFYRFQYESLSEYEKDVAKNYAVLRSYFSAYLKFYFIYKEQKKQVETEKKDNIDAIVRGFDGKSEAEIQETISGLGYMERMLVRAARSKAEAKAQGQEAKDLAKRSLERPTLQFLRRTGPYLRDNPPKNATPESILQTFGLRGGEFGNWQNQKDRQACLNYFYDAMVDMAYLLNIHPTSIGLTESAGKGLAIAFGSRGVGNFSAHFESSRFVINLTKKSGAGSLAHEYGHAIDNALSCTLHSETVTNSKTSYASDMTLNRPNAYYGYMLLLEFMQLNPNLVEEKQDTTCRYLTTKAVREGCYEEFKRNFGLYILMNNLHFVLNYREEYLCPYTETMIERMVMPRFQEISMTKGEICSLYKDIEKTYNIIPLTKVENLSSYMLSKTQTNFATDSEWLDKASSKSKAYWSSPREKFARAFETYVNKQMGYNTDYLVHGTDNTVHTPDGIRLIEVYPSQSHMAVIIPHMEALIKFYKVIFDVADFEYRVPTQKFVAGENVYDVEYVSTTELAKRAMEQIAKEEQGVTEQKAEEPKAEEPKVAEPKAEEPKVAEPEAEEPKVAEPEAEEPKVAEPEVEEPKAAEPEVEEPKAEEPKAEEPKVEEPKAEEPKVEEPKAAEPEVAEQKITEQKAEDKFSEKYKEQCADLKEALSSCSFMQSDKRVGGITLYLYPMENAYVNFTKSAFQVTLKSSKDTDLQEIVDNLILFFDTKLKCNINELSIYQQNFDKSESAIAFVISSTVYILSDSCFFARLQLKQNQRQATTNTHISEVS